MPNINGLLETFLFVEDPMRSYHFYKDVMQLEPYSEPDERGCLFELPGGQILGLLDIEAAQHDNHVSGGVIPACTTLPSGDSNIGHMAFKISRSSMKDWKTHLSDHDVEIEQVVDWEKGGTSIYFRDPDSHLLELATPGLWDLY